MARAFSFDEKVTPKRSRANKMQKLDSKSPNHKKRPAEFDWSFALLIISSLINICY